MFNPFKRKPAEKASNNDTESPTYDVTDEFTKEAMPLFEALHDLAKKYNIPLVAVACPSKSGEKYGVSGSIHLVGPRRTPEAFSIGAQFLHGGLDKGLNAAAPVGIMRALHRMTEGDDEGDDETAGESAARAEERPAGATLQ